MASAWRSLRGLKATAVVAEVGCDCGTCCLEVLVLISTPVFCLGQQSAFPIFVPISPAASVGSVHVTSLHCLVDG